MQAWAQQPQWAWAQTIPTDVLMNSGIDEVRDMQSDAAGNIYMLGTFTDDANLGPYLLLGQGQTDLFVAKFSPFGQCLWARSGGSSGEDLVGALRLDMAGNLYVTATIYQDFTTPCGTLLVPQPTNGSTMLWKLASDGTCRWNRLIARPMNQIAPGVSTARSLAVDGAGCPTIILETYNDQLLGDSVYPVSGSASWIVRCNMTGEVRWIKKFEQNASAGWAGVYSIARLSDTELVVLGGGVTVRLDSIILPNPGGFVAALDTAGAWQWARPFTSHNTSNAEITQLTADAHQIILSGRLGSTGGIRYDGQIALDTLAASTGYADGFTIGLGHTGALRYAYRMPGSGNQGTCIINGQALETGGALYLTGHFSGTVALIPGHPRTSIGVRDGFVVKLDTLGRAVWDLSAGVPPPGFMVPTGIRPLAIAVAGPAGPVIGGVLADTATLGAFTITSVPRGAYDLFIAGIGQVLGLSDESARQPALRLWPNPAHTTSTVEWPAQPAAAVLTVRDVLGRTVQSQRLPAHTSQARLECAHLPAGCYSVELVAGQYRQRTRLLIVGLAP